MVYLYASLGVAMLAGIMAMFEMGLSLTGRSLLPAPEDAYLQDASAKAVDQQLLKILVDRDALAPGLLDSDLCAELQAQLIAPEAPLDTPSDWLQGSRMPVKTGRWEGACLMSNGQHRVVVTSSPANEAFPYGLFSCVLKVGVDRCVFEQE